MKIFVKSNHRYSSTTTNGIGKQPLIYPSGAVGKVHDDLVKGLVTLGHEVHYLLEGGVEGNLPDGVHYTEKISKDMDVYFNLPMPGEAWLFTRHGHGVVKNHYESNGLTLDHCIFVSQTLAQFYKANRFVHNGINPEEYLFSAVKGDYFLYLASMGRGIPDQYLEKGLDIALNLAKSTGIKLKVAGSSDDYKVIQKIDNLCKQVDAEYLGDVRGTYKAELLAGAKALINPTQVFEGFGLVTAEALMSGTPVICSNKGACPEIVQPGVGFVCEELKDYVQAIETIHTISPDDCRELAFKKYHYLEMAKNYVKEFEKEIAFMATIKG